MTALESLAVAYAQEKLRQALNDNQFKPEDGFVPELEANFLLGAYNRCLALLKARQTA